MRLLSSDVACVSIPVDKMMRKEKSEEFMEISAAGSIQSTPRLSDDPAASALEDNECRIDYTLGKADSCECEDPTKHHVILEEKKCRDAALLVGITAPDNFVLTEDLYNHHPRGCFKDNCRSDSNSQCYFFNPIGNLPAQCAHPPFFPPQPDGSQPEVHGIPVCRREMFEYGTPGANPGANDGCPDGYERETDENKCFHASVCMSLECQGSEFIVTTKNQSRHDDFPLGCFLNQDNCIQYNPKLVNWLAPSNPIGRPLCRATPPSMRIHEMSKTGGTTEHVENGVKSNVP